MVLILIKFTSEKAFFSETVTASASIVNTYFSDHDAVRVECYDTDIADFHCAVNVWYPQIL